MTTILVSNLPPVELRRCPRRCGGQLLYFADEFDRPQLKCTLCSREAIKYPPCEMPPEDADHIEKMMENGAKRIALMMSA